MRKLLLLLHIYLIYYSVAEKEAYPKEWYAQELEREMEPLQLDEVTTEKNENKYFNDDKNTMQDNVDNSSNIISEDNDVAKSLHETINKSNITINSTDFISDADLKFTTEALETENNERKKTVEETQIEGDGMDMSTTTITYTSYHNSDVIKQETKNEGHDIKANDKNNHTKIDQNDQIIPPVLDKHPEIGLGSFRRSGHRPFQNQHAEHTVNDEPNVFLDLKYRSAKNNQEKHDEHQDEIESTLSPNSRMGSSDNTFSSGKSIDDYKNQVKSNAYTLDHSKFNDEIYTNYEKANAKSDKIKNDSVKENILRRSFNGKSKLVANVDFGAVNLPKQDNHNFNNRIESKQSHASDLLTKVDFLKIIKILISFINQKFANYDNCMNTQLDQHQPPSHLTQVFEDRDTLHKSPRHDYPTALPVIDVFRRKQKQASMEEQNHEQHNVKPNPDVNPPNPFLLMMARRNEMQRSIRSDDQYKFMKKN